MDITIPNPFPNPFAELVAHATAKLAEEQAFYANLARKGKRPHGSRIDRRPLWAATVYLAGIYSKRPVPLGVTWRGDAWGWLCARAQHLMANENQFDALIRLALCVRLPPREAIELLDERAAIREERERARKDARAEQLRAELRKLEGVGEEGEELPDNVVRFKARSA